MGFLDSIFKKEQYPPLDAAHPVAAQIQSLKSHLEPVVAKVSDRLELIPGPDASYLIIGKPEKQFGIVWVQGGKLNNFKALIEDHHIPPADITALTVKVANVYDRFKDAQRYSTSIGDKTVFVMLSEPMRAEIKTLIDGVSNA